MCVCVCVFCKITKARGIIRVITKCFITLEEIPARGNIFHENLPSRYGFEYERNKGERKKEHKADAHFVVANLWSVHAWLTRREMSDIEKGMVREKHANKETNSRRDLSFDFLGRCFATLLFTTIPFLRLLRLWKLRKNLISADWNFIMNIFSHFSNFRIQTQKI